MSALLFPSARNRVLLTPCHLKTISLCRLKCMHSVLDCSWLLLSTTFRLVVILILIIIINNWGPQANCNGNCNSMFYLKVISLFTILIESNVANHWLNITEKIWSCTFVLLKDKVHCERLALIYRYYYTVHN